MREFKLQIVTPDGVKFDGMAESVRVRAADGDIQVLAGHVDYIASLGTGRAKLIVGGEARLAAVSGGFISVSGGEVKIVSVTFEFREEIDLERAKRAKENAERLIREAKDDKELLIAEAKMKRAISRIDVAS